MNQLFKAGSIIIEELNANGFEAFFVGGCVRDYHMDRPIHDVDITTDAVPEEVENIFPHTVNVGVEHGTIIVLQNGIPFEVTTYRTQAGSSYGGHPGKMIFSNHLNADLKHRDFTMNAMAMTHHMSIHDPYEGMAAIKRKEIVTVGSALERFNEDALRMLRAIRFMSVMGFTPSPETEDAMISNASALTHVSVERVVTELKKMYNGMSVERAKEKLITTGLIQHIPFLKKVDIRQMHQSKTSTFLDELILQIIGDETLIDEVKYLKLSNDEKLAIKSCLSLYVSVKNDETPEHIAYHFEETAIRRLLNLNRTNRLITDITVLDKALETQPRLPIRSKKDLKINGRHLLEIFNLKSGRWIKECLNAIENEVFHGRLDNDYNEIVKWVKRHVEVKSGSVEFIK